MNSYENTQNWVLSELITMSREGLPAKPMTLVIDNQDVLSHICAKLDDNSLFQFARVNRSWREVATMLSDDLFWRCRAEHLAGKALTSPKHGIWMRAYYAILAMQTERGEIYQYRAGTRDLDILLILLQVRPTDCGEMKFFVDEGWSLSGDVFQYLLDSGLLVYGDDEARVMQIFLWLELSQDEHEGSPILASLLSPDYYDDAQDCLAELRRNLVRAGRTKTLIVLLDRYKHTNEDLYHLAVEALEDDKRDITAEMLIRRAELNQHQVDELFNTAITSDLIPTRTLRAFFDLNPELRSTITLKTLYRVIGAGDAEAVLLLLDCLDPTLVQRKSKDVLNVATRSNPEVLPLLLSRLE